MGKFITGIRIERNSPPVGVPVEECEKIDAEGCVIRFQRAVDVGIGERLKRFFSDLFDGVTKAKGLLCDPSREIPDTIFVKGKDIRITHRTGKEATGTWIEVSRGARTKEREINIEIILKRDAHADNMGRNAQVAATSPSGKNTVVSIPSPVAATAPTAATPPTMVVTVPQAVKAPETMQPLPEARPKPPVPPRETRPPLSTQSTATNAAATALKPLDEDIPPAPPLPTADMLSRPTPRSAPPQQATDMTTPANRQQEGPANEKTPIQTRGNPSESPSAKMLQDASKKLRPVEARKSDTPASTQTSTANQSDEGAALLKVMNTRYKAFQGAPQSVTRTDSDNSDWDE